jgi:fibulin 1/2
VDECGDPVANTCQSQTGGGQCINLPGTFRCNCPSGFDFDEPARRCVDVDECQRWAGHSCSLQARCENTVGSFRCICNAGYRLGPDQRTCEGFFSYFF